MFTGLISADDRPAAVDDFADGWVLQDGNALVLDIECRGSTLFGWQRSDILGLSGTKIIHPEDRSRFRAAQQRSLRSADEPPIQIRCRSRAGWWLQTECRFTPVADHVGSEGRLTVLGIRDVSENAPRRVAIELAGELRRSFLSAPTVERAWAECLDRIAEATGSSAALVWGSADSGCTIRHGRSTDRAGAALVAERLGTTCSDMTTALGHSWATGDVTTALVDDVCSIPIAHDLNSGTISVLVPLQHDDATHCVVELVGPTDVGDRYDSSIAALRDVAVSVHRREHDRELSSEELSFRLIFDEAAIGMCILDIDGRYLAVNAALCAFLGYTADELLGVGFRDLTYADDLAHDDSVISEMLSGALSDSQFEKRYVHADGTILWASLAMSLVRRDGAPLHFIAQITDIGDRKTAEVELTRAMAMFRAAFDHSGIGMALVHLDGETRGQVINANAAFAAITQTRLADILSQPLHQVIRSADSHQVDQFLDDVGTVHAVTQRDEFRIDGATGTTTWVRMVVAPVRDRRENDRIAVVQIEDITSVRRAQDQLAHIALHDSLTGLPNRSLIMDRISTARRRGLDSGTRIGILFSDLDKFKHVNDSFGHEAGDELLREVASRFRSRLRPQDTAARLGGDEFVILCEGLSPDDGTALAELNDIAERMHRALREPVLLDGREVFVSISIGMAVVEDVEEDVRTMLGNADVAMYRAKARGRSRSEPYDANVRNEATDRLRLDTELHHAIARDQLTVVYQPIVELPSGRVRGAEALLRWNHPELGQVRPDHFIDVAEDSELIVHLGDFVIDRVGQHLSTRSSDDFYVTANVSARQLSRTDFVDTVEKTLDRHRLAPHRLAVELTENVLMDAAGSSLGQLNALRSLGVRVGVDDFGTGYASLTYLKQLPVSFVKIDRSFVSGLVDDADDRTIADAVIGLAAALELDVVAEGVETPKQAEILTELGCTYAQGYLYGRPAPPSSNRPPMEPQAMTRR